MSLRRQDTRSSLHIKKFTKALAEAFFAGAFAFVFEILTQFFISIDNTKYN